MSFILGDVFIGNFPVTQTFGGNPTDYAKFGLKGHNGLDFGVPTGTLVLAASDGWVSEMGTDPGGYGNYIKVVHNGYLTLYGHLQQQVVKLHDVVVSGQLIGLSNNTGNSSGPHLHFGVAPCDAKGIKVELTNGYSGYIDPLGVRCMWQIKNLTKPIAPPSPIIAPGSNGDDLRALTVLYKAIQDLRTFDGQRFGNLEGLARELVDSYPKYQDQVSKINQGLLIYSIQTNSPVK